jgi:phytoene dehydrogenase-like protein
MTEGTDKALAAIDRKLAVHEFFTEKLGAEPEQAEIASRALADSFTLTGATLMFNGKIARDAVDDVRQHLRTQHYDFLLPSEKPAAATLDPHLLTRAFVDGRPDARGAVFRQVGDRAKFDALARDYGLRDGNDYRRGIGRAPAKGAADSNNKSREGNPWRAESWNVTAQGRVFKSDAALAASLAKSAGSHIGATRPPRRAA